MARKKKIGLNDLGRLPVTKVEDNLDYETREQFYAREAREEEARRTAPTRQIIHEEQTKFQAELAAHSQRVKRHYSRPLADIEDDIRHSDALADPRGLPTTETPISMKEFDTRLKSFVEGLPAKGVTLTGDSPRRLALYCFVQYENGTVIDDTTLTEMFTRTLSLKIYSDGVTGELAKPVVHQTTEEPSATPTWDAVQDLSTEHRDERKKVLAAVGEDFTSEVAAFFGLWLDQLQRDYGYTMPAAVTKKALAFITERNLSPLRHETYNLVRRTFTKCGWMPAGMLTERERLDDLVESNDVSDRDVRRQINLKHREILDAEPPLVPHK